VIARLYVLLPFSLQIPEGETFHVREYIEHGYRIQVFPPAQSDLPGSNGPVDELTMEGRPAISVNALRIDFCKVEFDKRSSTDCDPSYEIMNQAINSFLVRLRYVTRAAQIRPIDFPESTLWRLEYLNDSGAELAKQEGLVRGRGAIAFSFRYIGLTSPVWDSVHDLPPDFQPPTWDDLILDAYDALPEIGPP
jgi:hypothetical protein